MSDGRTLDEDTWRRLAQLAEFGVLSASLLHELRQPLFAVKATAQLAHHRGEALEGEGLQQLLAHVREIEELLDHYAGFNRQEAAPLPFDLGEEARRGVAMMTHRARQLRVSLDMALHPRPLVVRGRPGAIRQVVVNLLHNGIDAAEGRPEARVLLTTLLLGGEAVIEVRDNGAGISEDMRARLFEPFATSKPSGRGTGLGLHIAHQLVVEAGGALVLDDATGGGTLVRVSLPLETA